jgi:hypothetical protein
MDGTGNMQLTALKARLKNYGKIEITLSGKSMEPYLFAGDRARVTPYRTLLPGHIYLFEILGSNKLVAHRLIRFTENVAVLKGDQTGIFEQVSLENLWGEISAVMLNDCTSWTTRVYPMIRTRLARHLSKMIGFHCLNHHATNRRFHLLICRIMDRLLSSMRADLKKASMPFNQSRPSKYLT